jgi:hypothetical protein
MVALFPSKSSRSFPVSEALGDSAPPLPSGTWCCSIVCQGPPTNGLHSPHHFHILAPHSHPGPHSTGSPITGYGRFLQAPPGSGPSTDSEIHFIPISHPLLPLRSYAVSTQLRLHSFGPQAGLLHPCNVEVHCSTIKTLLEVSLPVSCVALPC